MSSSYAGSSVPIILADGKERHLRYSLGALKRIKAEFVKLPETLTVDEQKSLDDAIAAANNAIIAASAIATTTPDEMFALKRNLHAAQVALNVKTYERTAFAQFMAYRAEEVLPAWIFAGLVEKEGLTEHILAEELLLGPMIDDAQEAFVEAFFGRRQKLFIAAARVEQDARAEKRLADVTPAPKPVPPVLPDVTVN